MNSSKILVVFALKEEFEYFIDVLRIKVVDSDDIFRECHIRTANNGYLLFYCYCLPIMGKTSVLKELPKVLEIVKPTTVINIGISGRVDDSYLIGDVIIGESIYDYTENAKLFDHENGGVKIEPIVSQKNVSNALKRACQIYSYKCFKSTSEKYIYLHFSHEELNSLRNDTRPVKIEIAPIITSPFVDISDKIKESYKQINRKIGVVEMEAFSIEDIIDQQNEGQDFKIESLYIKGISDYSNITKENGLKDIQRKYAMLNSSLVFKNFMNKHPLIGTIREFQSEDFDEIFNENHLFVKSQYKTLKNRISIEDFKIFSLLFLILFETKNIKLSKESLFEDFYSKLVVDNKYNSIKICGFSGSGKSTFLIILYNYLLIQFKSKDLLFPIYINLEYYYRKYEKYSSIDLQTFILKSFELDIHHAEKIIQKLSLKKIILIIDGIDHHRDSSELLDYINSLSKILNYDVKKVYGVQHIPEKTILNSTYIKTAFNTNIEIHFKDLNFDDPQLEMFIQLFLIHSGVDEIEESTKNILSLLQNKKFQNIDFYTLSRLVDNIDNIDNLNIYEIIQKYCVHVLSGFNMDINWLSKLAYQHHIIRKEEEKVRYENLAVWKLIHQNPKIAYYLIAKQVIDNVLSIHNPSDSTLNSDLSFVYPFQINYFCKEILNQDRAKQEEVLTKIRIILKCNNWHSIAVACYLAGRISDKGLQNQAKGLLIDFLKEKGDIVVPSVDRDKYLFALRTIYISLAYLGEIKYEQKYIKRLIKDKAWDDINRGFHLVYYGDQEYNPAFGLAQHDFLEDCSQTFDQLSRRIKNFNRSNLYNIELFTLLSLAVQRIGSDFLSHNQITQIKELLNDTQSIRRIKNNVDVYGFTMYAKGIFEEMLFTKFSPFIEMMNLKFVDRAGWIKRGISYCESVASHTLFAYLLGSIYLPEKYEEEFLDCEKYEKNIILEMLLIHDLAESKYGDIIVKEDKDKENEAKYFEDSKWFSFILPNENKVHRFYKLWNDFENGITINGKIAKEIDKIEAYIQLLYYKHVKGENLTAAQISEWKKDFEGTKTLKFKVTQDILDMAEKYFNDLGEIKD